MKYSQNTAQETMFSFDLIKVELPKENELIRMAQEIDWDAMIEKEIVRMNRRLIRLGKRMMNKVLSTMEEHRKEVSVKLRKNIRKVVRTAKEILRQQAEMIRSKTRRMKDRIVSFHEPLVRPIFRGKDSCGTEFGPKLRVSVVGGSLIQSSGVSNDNTSDTKMVRACLKTHRRTFGHDPTELIADRGAHSPKTHALLKRKGITDGIQYRGRIPHHASLAPPATLRRMY